MTTMDQGGQPMRPLGVGELLDASIKLVRRHFKALALVTLLVSIPVELLGGIVTVSTTDFCEGPQCEEEFAPDTVFVWEDDVAYYGGQVVIALLAVLQFLLVQVACFRILAEGYLGRDVAAGDSARYALRRGGATLWLTVLLFVAVLLGTIALIIPGIYLIIAFSVAIPVLLVEDLRGSKALSRSLSLVRGHWWGVFLKLFVSTLLISIAAAAIGGVFFAALFLAVDQASYAALVLQGLINVVVTVVTTPFLAAVATLIYFDLRVRKEGFDLAVLAEGMGGAGATAPAPARVTAGGDTDAFGRPAEPGGSWAPPTSGSVAPPSAWAPPGSQEEPPADDLPRTADGEPRAPDADDPPPADGPGGWAPPEPGRPREP